ncbi:MAG: DUF2889 domain-containing protein [Alphaproteobacteria bacterium]|nr:DUF2889 domain-containing protein [Alphaproteobacteria bacterium]
MPLSDPAERELLHLRDIAIRGYRRADGLFDVEAHLTDTKSYGFANQDRGYVAAGEPLHGMWMRMTVDEDLTIVACEAATEFAPYAICPGAAPNFARLAGLSIKRGFLRAAAERIGGTQGCTHLRELLQQMATTALQTLYAVRTRREDPESGEKPAILNTCFAYATDSPVVRRRWPHLYTGAEQGAEARPQPGG